MLIKLTPEINCWTFSNFTMFTIMTITKTKIQSFPRKTSCQVGIIISITVVTFMLAQCAQNFLTKWSFKIHFIFYFSDSPVRFRSHSWSDFTLPTLCPGVNFINAHEQLLHAQIPKAQKELSVFFALSGSACSKAACWMLMKLTPDTGISSSVCRGQIGLLTSSSDIFRDRWRKIHSVPRIVALVSTLATGRSLACALACSCQ